MQGFLSRSQVTGSEDNDAPLNMKSSMAQAEARRHFFVNVISVSSDEGM